jgi:1-acyl-sn-glycerol-3-phosphate acyltransferase
MDRHVLKRWVKALFCDLMIVELEGVENVPASGGCILTTNHLSRMDTPLLMIAVNRDDMCALVADKYRLNPLFSLIVRSTNSIWINREIADHTAMRAALAHLRTGGLLGIAPEGTRSQVGTMLEAKSGTVLLADRADVPIVPVGITGTEDCMAKLGRFQRPTVRARFGKPYHLAPIDRATREESTRRNTDEVMCRIAALIPEKYHGFYQGHPRIQEILKEERA